MRQVQARLVCVCRGERPGVKRSLLCSLCRAVLFHLRGIFSPGFLQQLEEMRVPSDVKEVQGITGVERSLVFIYSTTIYAFSQQLGSPPPPGFSHSQVGRLRAGRQHGFHPASPIWQEIPVCCVNLQGLTADNHNKFLPPLGVWDVAIRHGAGSGSALREPEPGGPRDERCKQCWNWGERLWVWHLEGTGVCALPAPCSAPLCGQKSPGERGPKWCPRGPQVRGLLTASACNQPSKGKASLPWLAFLCLKSCSFSAFYTRSLPQT